MPAATTAPGLKPPSLAGAIAAAMQPVPGVAPGTPVAQAVAAMVAARASAVLVLDAEGRAQGILTEQDVARRVVFQMPPETPVQAAMTAPVISVGADQLLYRAIGLMHRHRLRHLAVLDDAGRPLGMLQRGDTLALLGGRQLAHLDTLAAQQDEPEMAAAKAAQADLAQAMLDDGAAAAEAVGLVSEVNLDLHRQVLARTLAAQPTPPPVPFTLLVMGSLGRGESLLAPDQDNGLILQDYPDADHDAVDAWFRPFTEAFNAALDTVGFPLCKGHVMARNPLWRKRESAWVAQFTQWADKRSAAALLFAEIAFDFAPAWGDPAPAQRLRQALRGILRRHPALLAALAAEGAKLGVGLTFWGRFRDDEHGPGTRTDLKLSGMMPLAAAVRLLALRHGVAQTGTAARLEVLRAESHLAPADHATLAAAFALLQGLLLRQQLADRAAGLAVGSLVDTARLDAAARAPLKDALRGIAAFAKATRMELTGGL
jgi:signal-transduction protein with cAMP-binding, CBS, and nucleotidyltransferase domain